MFVDSISYLDTLDKSKDAVLAVIDPDGYKQIPWDSLLKVLKYPRLDALITLTAHGMSRNLTQDKQNNRSLIEFFGVDKNHEFSNIDDELNQYANKILNETGKFVLPLLIKTKHNHYYYIITVSRSKAAFKVLKYLRDKLDPVSNEDLTRVVGRISSEIKTLEDFF